jgi:peptidyl-prolyl cis-trans isomerase D
MISSMQKNKKWLLPTIWISTIAFVGAGFVGWGSYNPTASSGANIAQVGNREIPLKNMQQEYNNLYTQYQKMFGDQFNKELADKLNLEKIAYNNLIQRYLVLNLADELGFMATNEEVFKELLSIPSFITNNKFDKEKYKLVLSQNRLKVKDFEENIKIDLTIRKLQNIYKMNADEQIVKKVNKLFFSQDKVEIAIIDSSNINITSSIKDIENYYKKNKQNYKTIEKYKVNLYKIAIKGDEKSSKKTALKKYLKLKKATIKFEDTELLDTNYASLSKEEQNKIFSSKLGTILKPMQVDDDFVIYQLIEKIKPKIIALSDVKDTVTSDYNDFQKSLLLNIEKENLLKNFKGKNIGYINKSSLPNIDGLDQNETKSLMQKISSTLSILDFVKLSDKVVVFKILDTKMGSYDEKNNNTVIQNLEQVKNNIAMTNIVKKIQNKYEIISNYKVK